MLGFFTVFLLQCLNGLKLFLVGFPTVWFFKSCLFFLEPSVQRSLGLPVAQSGEGWMCLGLLLGKKYIFFSFKVIYSLFFVQLFSWQVVCVCGFWGFFLSKG